MNALQWIKTVAGNDTLREIARRSKLSDATLSRQLSKDALTFDVVISIARGYDTSVIAGLVATGFITEAEASIDSTGAALQAATDDQLVDEVYRRILRGSDAYDGAITRPRRHLSAVTDVAAQVDDEPSIKQPPAKQRTAAKRGIRKADQAPHAE